MPAFSESRPFQDVIAIDGPAAAGKSTVARELASRLGIGYFDTGLLYRAVTLAALDRNIDLDSDQALGDLIAELQIDVSGDGRVTINGLDVSENLRSPAVNAAVSAVSAKSAVRAALLPIQRSIAAGRAIVMVGRDVATVVLPEAGLKIYLNASVEERARRRHLELTEQGAETSRESVHAEIERRDEFDSTREIAPLRPADDAVVIDTDDLTIDQVVDRLESMVVAEKQQDNKRRGNLSDPGSALALAPEEFEGSARRRFRGKAVHRLVWPVLRFLTNVQQRGLEHIPREGPLLYVSNHLHNADPMIEYFAFLRPLHFMGKQELFDIPIAKQIAESSGGFPVDRGKVDREALKQAELRLARGIAVGIYPEGTRSVTGSMTEAKAGAGLLALKTGAPVLPVAIYGSERLPFNGKKAATARSHSLESDAKRTVRIIYGEPFYIPRMIDGHKVGAAEATEIMMLEIARLLPEDYRGVYADRLRANLDRHIIPLRQSSPASAP
jgi:cytidylate kinase